MLALNGLEEKSASMSQSIVGRKVPGEIVSVVVMVVVGAEGNPDDC